MDNKKRKYDSFIVPATNMSEWLMSAEQASEIIVDILVYSNVSKKSSILLPGIGISRVGKLLYDKGYKNLYIVDLEPSSVEYQKVIFENNNDIVIRKHDILEDSFPANLMFDIVIDKSLMDVFLRQSNSKLAWNNIIKVLKDDGIYIGLSIFHRKWKRYCNKNYFSEVKYGSIEIPKYSRTRPTIQTYSQPVCILIGVRNQIENKQKNQQQQIKQKFDKSFLLSNITFSDLDSFPTASFPTDSSMF